MALYILVYFSDANKNRIQKSQDMALGQKNEIYLILKIAKLFGTELIHVELEPVFRFCQRNHVFQRFVSETKIPFRDKCTHTRKQPFCSWVNLGNWLPAWKPFSSVRISRSSEKLVRFYCSLSYIVSYTSDEGLRTCQRSPNTLRWSEGLQSDFLIQFLL